MAAVALSALSAVWLIAVPLGPDACALVLPGPRNCFTFDRLRAAVAPTVLLIVLAVGTLLAVILAPRTPGRAAAAGALALALAGVASYLVVAWIPALAYVT
ncbi:hypothetical protein N3K63_02640 [Microbacterium sp. W1N]|uniref:hypothetical protein n=1 Tax=Microbacterium festucae TaxID=2977531 RepID=UPI0021C126FB|nr:hypothetical protein [Microbacterium festucae]MCT9819180.1 hypothetical protein [Microbacterium festucae]